MEYRYTVCHSEGISQLVGAHNWIPKALGKTQRDCKDQ